MKQLDDGNILILEDDLLKVIYIEGNKIVELSKIKAEGDKIFILLDGNFMTKEIVDYIKTIYLYYYSNKKLYYYKQFSLDNIIKKGGGIKDICPINKNRVAITCYEEGKLYGYNEYLLIYDFIEEQKKKMMKIDGGKNKLCLINENNLILCSNKFLLIDFEDFQIIGELKSDISFEDILPLNEKSFITYDIGFTQYEIDLKNKKPIIRKGSGGINIFHILHSIQKYPGNKLVIGNDDTIAIVGE